MMTRLFVAVALGGCGISSSDVEVFAQFDDRGEHGGILVFASHGTNLQDDVPLDDATATLHVRSQSIPLEHSGGRLYADISLSPTVASDEPFDLELSRDGATATLMVAAPPAIDLTAPVPVFVPRSQDVSISWATASDDQMTWMIDGGFCINGDGASIAPGATQFLLHTSTDEGGALSEPTCTSGLHMQRLRVVTSGNDGFESVQLLYVRDLDIPFTSTP